MRTILFRGKSAHCDAWCYGSFVEYEDERAICGFDVYREGNSDWMEEKIDYDTIGQYTGLRDAEGNAIYEGDILQGCNESIRHEIFYNDKEARFEGALDGEKKVSGNISQEWIYNFGKVVIGNIHDNPEWINWR